LDLYDGKASFYKSGAAPSYVLREDGLFKLRSKTLPMGILRQTDIKRLHFDIADGDVIVMVSDGVTGGKEECPWLFDLLKRYAGTENIECVAEQILNRARLENGNDDMSVIVLRITHLSFVKER